MTSKLVVNTIEADTGISSVSFASSISMSSTSKFHFGDAGIDIGADTNINRPASGVLGFNINGSEKARIDSSGRVLIGTTTEGSTSADTLTIAESSNSGITIRSGASNAGHIYFADGTSGASEYMGIVFYDHNSNYMAFWTNGSAERMRIDSSGRVHIATTSGNEKLNVNGAVRVSGSSANFNAGLEGALVDYDTSNNIARFGHVNGASGSARPVSFVIGGSEKARIDSAGRVLIGTSSSRNVGGSTTNSKLQIEGTSTNTSSMSLVNNENSTAAPFVFFGKTRGNSAGESGIVQSGDTLGGLSFIGADSVDTNNRTAEITAVVNGTPANNTIPTDLVFSTSTQHAGQLTERLRIYSDGRVAVNQPNGTGFSTGKVHIKSSASNRGQLYLEQNNANDGFMINQDGPNGGHLKFVRDIGGTQTVNVLFRSDRGICFNGDSAAANALDDYEEGTWTPEISSQSGSITSYTTQIGSYTKIGRTVIAEYDIRISNKGNISGGYLLLNLPMNHVGSRAGSGTVYYFQNLNHSVSSLQIELGGATPTRGWLLGVTGTQNSQNSYLGAAYLTNTTQITGQLVYRVS